VLLVVLIFLMLSTTYSRFTELQVTCRSPMPRSCASGRARSSSRGRRRPLRVNREPLEGRSVERWPPSSPAPAGRCHRDDHGDRLGRRAAAHQSVVNVLDAARRAGLPRLTFATQTAGGGSALSAAMRAATRARAARGWYQGPGPTPAWRPAPAVVAVRRAAGLRGPALWRLGWRRPWQAPLPVLVVGNLVAGGAGKTPAVHRADRLLRRGLAPGRRLARPWPQFAGTVLARSGPTCRQPVGDEPC
jgi:biopolymer transport protein ExbD